MNSLSNIHTHTTLCDGKNTPEEMVAAAIRLGFTDLGFSAHSPAPYDPGCPGVQSESEYRNKIAGLRDEYRGKIEILCGLETDTYAPTDAGNYDYIIGSNHFLPVENGVYVAVDGDRDLLAATLNERYGNDGIAMAKEYYALQYQGICQQRPDVVGHFDLIKKYNREGSLFDEESAAYQTLARSALDAVLEVLDEYGGMLEVNTGAMTRMLRDDPYPSLFLLQHAAKRNARVIITSDCHKESALNAYFDVAQELLKKAGFARMMVLKNGQFQQVGID